MLWSRLAAGAAAAFMAAGLSGCFQPLYSESAHPGLVEDVRAIEVAPIKDRFGHYFVEDLRSALNGTGQPVTPKYKLTAKLSTSQQTPTVNTEIGVASSATVTGDADFTLVRLSDNKEVFKDKATAVAAYDRTTQRYAAMRAARDAEIRLSRALADEVSLRVASKISTLPPAPTPSPPAKPATGAQAGAAKPPAASTTSPAPSTPPDSSTPPASPTPMFGPTGPDNPT